MEVLRAIEAERLPFSQVAQWLERHIFGKKLEALNKNLEFYHFRHG